MKSIPESRIEAWDRSNSVNRQVHPAVKILATEVGVALVVLLAWFVLLVTR